MNRRLLMASWALSALAFSLLPRRARAAPPPLARRLHALFEHPASAAAIGAAYLRLMPGEGDIDSLLAQLLPEGEVPDEATLRRRLAARQREDFATGRTIVLDGWILSRTEARLCAVVALTGA